jgi:hypothetical protein
MRLCLAVLCSLGVSFAAQTTFSTFLGGSGVDQSSAVAADAKGNTYIAGTTFSPDFPTTASPAHLASQQFSKVFVAKFDPSGILVFSLVVGGSGSDTGRAIAIDPAGNVYVTGYTQSTDFPVTPKAFQSKLNLSPLLDPTIYKQDAFVLKMAPDGTIVYATFLGGTRREFAESIAVDAAGNAYVAGYTDSPDFPTTSGAFQEHIPAGTFGQQSGFVAKLDAKGATLVWGTYLSGSGLDMPHAIAVGPDGSAVVAGETESRAFPVRNAVQGAFGGTTNFPIYHPDGFAARLTADGSDVVYSTYLGGVAGDVVRAVAVDAANHAYLAGTTNSGALPAGTPQYLAGSLFYRTFDGGVTVDAPSGGLATSAILALKVDPYDIRTVYAGTAEGLFKSTDGGSTWSQTALIQIGVGTITIDPQNSAVVYAASAPASQFGTRTALGNHGGLWKSTDGGATFTLLPLISGAIEPENNVGANAFVNFLIVDPAHSQTVYAVTGSGGTSVGGAAPIFKSTDGGATWQASGSGIHASLTGFAMDPGNSSTLYATTPSLLCCGLGASLTVGQFFRTDDAGATWKPLSSGSFPDLTAGPGVLFSGNRMSTDGGTTWANRTAGPPRILQADTTGIYGVETSTRLNISTDGGATWNAVGGFPVQSYTAFAAAQGAIYQGTFVWNDSFVTQLDAAGAVVYTRYVGGSGYDEAKSIALDPSGAVYVAGLTTSYDFPAVGELMEFDGGFAPNLGANGGAGNAFVTALDATGAISFSSNTGTVLSYPGMGIAFDPSGVLHTAATTSLHGPKSIQINAIAIH